MALRETNPKVLHFRIYPTFIEANKEQIKTINRHSYYRLAAYQGETLLGDMMEGASPAILADKIFLTKALINFSQAVKDKEVIIKMTEYFESEKLVGVGTFDPQNIKRKFLEESQRFFSLQTAIINTSNGPLKLIFSIFVEADKHELDQYIKRFKENQRNVLRAKRKINSYKKQLENKLKERERSRSKSKGKRRNDLSDIKETKEDSRLQKRELYDQESQIKINFITRDRSRGRKRDDNSFESAPRGTYLEIDSAAKFHTKKLEKHIKKSLKPLNEAQEKEYLALTSMIEQYRNNSQLASVFQNGSASLLSDGSEESEMRLNDQVETYSEKAIKNFRSNVSRCFNLTMILLAILLIYFVIAPSKRFTKPQKKIKGGHKASKNQM